MFNVRTILGRAVVIATALTASFSWTATLTVTVANVADEAGQIRISVYDEETWLDRERQVAREFVLPADASVEASFELPPGTYAVAVLHDVNDNGRMDYRLMRLPKEPYGLSNGVVPRFGPPKFADCAFAVADEDLDITIELRD